MVNDIIKPVGLNDEPTCPQEVVARAVEFFENDEGAAEQWLNRPHRALNWQTPGRVASRNKEGAKLILLLLDRLERGIFD